MEIPIACSLDASDARAQLDEWKELFARVVTSVERVSPLRFDALLQPELAELSELVQLAQREKACCPFFDFALIIDCASTKFVVSVPENASSVLDHFVTNVGP
jgi:hypothetical protein